MSPYVRLRRCTVIKIVRNCAWGDITSRRRDRRNFDDLFFSTTRVSKRYISGNS
ncbi:hypothetical protein CDL15_Pgr012798 [Punica granatum]|uniref:Uncharacterized protein n=1 Tax=Punica granatum TaxID=22663 RepID=A0A218XED8_PUNGR|nr:hypothetical protein CDL15_Pgr012798 [Punica granatum]